MKLEVTRTVTKFPTDNDLQNKVTTSMTTIGGSAPAYKYDVAYDQATALANNFQIQDATLYTYRVYHGNTFSLDLMSLLPADSVQTDLVFLDVACVEETDDQKKIPGRFRIILNDGVNPIDLGNLSSFSLTNLKDNGLTSITLDDVDCPADKGLVILVYIGVSTAHGTPPLV